MPLIHGKQIKNATIPTSKLEAGFLSADAAGRALMGAGYFDAATASAKIAASALALSLLAEPVIQADGGQAFTADQPMGGFKLTGLGDGVSASDAATRGQLDAAIAGLNWKDAALVATAAALPAVTYANGASGVGATLTADAVGVLTVDGVATVLGDRVVVKDQVAGLQNGIYDVTTEGTAGVAFILTRVTDADVSAELDSAAVFVQQGTANKKIGYTQTVSNPTIGTTGLTFTPFTGTAALTFAAPGSIQPDDAAAEGVASTLARSDHKHSIVAAAPTITAKSENTAAGEGVATSFMRSDAQVQAATAAPATTIKSEVTTAAQGAADTMLRSDAQIQAATAAPVAVGTANAQGVSSSLARADHVHDSPAPTASNKSMAGLVTAADGAKATNTTVAATPALNSYVGVRVGGISAQVGDTGAFATSECYFGQGDTVTGRAIADIVAGDTLRWNGTVAGYELAASDVIDFEYVV